MQGSHYQAQAIANRWVLDWARADQKNGTLATWLGFCNACVPDQIQQRLLPALSMPNSEHNLCLHAALRSTGTF